MCVLYVRTFVDEFTAVAALKDNWNAVVAVFCLLETTVRTGFAIPLVEVV